MSNKSNNKKVKTNKNNKNKVAEQTNDKTEEKSFLKLFFSTVLGAIIIFILYKIMVKGEDIRFTSAFMQLLGKDLSLNIGNRIGEIFTSKLWLLLMILSFIAGLIGYKYNSKISKNLFFFSLSVFISFIFTSIFKVIIGRYRPYVFFDGINIMPYHHFCLKKDESHSAPSAHTAFAFAALFSFSKIINKKSIALLCAIIAIIIAFSRIIALRHYLSDVIFGGYIGIFSVYWSEFIFNKIYFKKKK